MSVKVMAKVWDHFPLGGGEFLTALCLADHADHEGGNIFPSVARIAMKTQQSERTVQRHIGAMKEAGWLLEVAPATGKPGQATAYRIPIELLPPTVEGRVSICHPSTYPHGCHPVQRGVTNQVKTGDTAMSPKLGLPVIEPSRPYEKRSKSKPTPRTSSPEGLKRVKALLGMQGKAQ